MIEDNSQPDQGLYSFVGKDLYRLVLSQTLINNLPQLPPVSPADISNGVFTNNLNVQENVIQGGKSKFDNSETGFIIGADQGVYKFYIGTPTHYLNFDGSTVTIVPSLSVSSINIPDTTTANSFHVDSSGNAWWGTNVATGYATAPASVTKAGVAVFSSITATGTIQATGGFIGTATALVFESQGVNVGTTGHVRGGQTDYATGTGFFLGYSGAQYKFSIGSSTQFLTWDGSTLTTTGNLQTSTGTGQRVVLSGSSNALDFYDASNNSLVNLRTSGVQINSTIYTNGMQAALFQNVASLAVTIGSTSEIMRIRVNNASSTSNVLTLENNASGATGIPLNMIQGNTTSSHFKKYESRDGNVTWVSDGTTPNGNLSGTAGDVCFNADSNQIYYCTGTTNWTNVSVKKFGGTGADGALSVSSGTTTIDCANAAVVVKNYTSISITGTGKIAFSNPHTNGTIVVFKSQGNVTITSSATSISLVGMGGAGGAGGAGNVTSGAAGTNGNLGTGVQYREQVYGNGSLSNNNTNNRNGTGGVAMQFGFYIMSPTGNTQKKSVNLFAGSGGGGGAGGDANDTGGTTGGTGGTGGNGGGGFYIECGGALNFTGSIDVSGANGSTGGAGAVSGGNTCGAGGGGGGGGGGGSCVILYNSLTSNSGTITAKGGVGGSSGAVTYNGTAPPGGSPNTYGGGGGGGGSGYNVGGDGGGSGVTGSPGNSGNASAGSGSGGAAGEGGGSAGPTAGNGGTVSSASQHYYVAANTMFT